MADWRGRWLQEAQLHASFSKDPSTKVGAVIVGGDQIPVSTGWNGFPRGYPDTPELLNDRTKKLPLTIHAELNAILNAARKGRSTEGCSLYCTHVPCSLCAPPIVQAGIVEVIVPVGENPDYDSRWFESYQFSIQLFKDTHVTLLRV
jgi:dCMP deaminase